MKRWLLLLLLPLLLAGCSDNAPPTDAVAVPTEPAGLYDPEDPLTELTDGAVRIYDAEGRGYHTAIPLGDNLLLIRQWEMLLLEGPELVPVLTRPQVYDKLFPLPDGVACWIREEGHILFLNDKLREISRLQMPADFTGEPFLTDDGSALYYSAGSEIKVLELETGIDRPVYRSPEKQVTLTALLWDCGVLRCTETDGENSETLILSAQTGQILAAGVGYESLVADGGGFFTEVTDGVVTQLVFGTDDGNIGTVHSIEAGGTLHPVPEENTLLVLYSGGEGFRIDRYDLLTGLRAASVTLPGVSEIWDIRMNGDGTVWFFCDADGEPLCCWNTADSALEEDTVYTAPYYNRDNPDTQGLAAMAAKAEEIGNRFGIQILIGQSVLDAMPDDYTYIPEYMVPAYEQYLSAAEQALSRFPEGFFAKAMEPRGGVLRLCLVRAISGVAEQGTVDQSQGIQFWADKDAVCAVILNDTLEQSLYHTLMHVMESRIFSKTPAFDEWNKLNPQGFAYDNDYLANLNRDDGQYLEGENRYFIDSFAMSYAREDRARIFEYACMPGNEDCFRSNAMQAKLQAICSGIRKAFGLTKYTEPLIWEQYLAQQ